MSSVETQGSTIEEAVATALAQLQAERDQVEIEIIAQATKGFLGIGGKKARVRATLRSSLAPQELEPESIAVAPTERPASRRPVSSASDIQPAPVSKETGEKACQALTETLRLMGTEVPVSLDVQGPEAVINLEETLGGLLVGRKGQTLDALEYLLNRMITRGDEEEAHLVLDAEGYRERRRQSLESLALRLGERAKRRRKTVTLNPLSPRDRRVVHLVLEDDPLVNTQSVGRGHLRRLSIVPENGSNAHRDRPRSAERPRGAARS
jgi:spoIIIJ-associated protein